MGGIKVQIEFKKKKKNKIIVRYSVHHLANGNFWFTETVSINFNLKTHLEKTSKTDAKDVSSPAFLSLLLNLLNS